MRLLALFVALTLPTATRAQGFVDRDLTRVEASAKAALGTGFIGRPAPEQLLFTCPTCAGEPTVAVIIGRQADGTEARVRSGATTIATLEKLCQARSPTCTLTALAVAPAVGWVTAYPIGDTAGATAVILRDGDLLTIRSLATDAAAARASIDRLLPVLRARVIGN